MGRFYSLISILFIALFLAGCARLPAGKELVAEPLPTGASERAWPLKNWQTSTPAEQGMDADRLARLLDAIDETQLNLHSLLVIRHGKIVLEKYFGDYRPDTRHEQYSCTKSFLSALVGIALEQGAIAGLERTVVSFFPKKSFAHLDERKARMTVEHLLTMTSGLDWQEGDPIYREMYISPDWVRYVLDIPMAAEPGSAFNYCSGCSHLLSAILQEATGMNTFRFAQENLFLPLGITDAEWSTDSHGTPIGGWGLQITPRDMAKLGYLYLNGGNWNGKQIVPAAWVQASVEKHVENPDGLDYGYQWWIYPSHGAYAALGRAGQTILVAPDLDLIVVTTADVEGHEAIFDLIEKFVFTAIS